jgi:hypothetical protein
VWHMGRGAPRPAGGLERRAVRTPRPTARGRGTRRAGARDVAAQQHPGLDMLLSPV